MNRNKIRGNLNKRSRILIIDRTDNTISYNKVCDPGDHIIETKLCDHILLLIPDDGENANGKIIKYD